MTVLTSAVAAKRPAPAFQHRQAPGRSVASPLPRPKRQRARPPLHPEGRCPAVARRHDHQLGCRHLRRPQDGAHDGGGVVRDLAPRLRHPACLDGAAGGGSPGAHGGGVRPDAAVGGAPVTRQAWTAQLRMEGLADSYVYALHARLAQVFSDAVHDGIIARSPCSRRPSPGAGRQRPYVATTEQVWGLYDAMPERLGAAVLLGAFAGLRAGRDVWAAGVRRRLHARSRAPSGAVPGRAGSRARRRGLRSRFRSPLPSSCRLTSPGSPVGGPRRCSGTSGATSSAPGPWSARSGRRETVFRACRRASRTTTSATISPRS